MVRQLPFSGPVRIDCRQMSPAAAVRRIEDLLKRLRGGPRLLHVVGDGDMAGGVLDWVRVGRARVEVVESPDRIDLYVFLLPDDFDGHPFLAWRPPLHDADATPDGVHVSVGV